MDVYGCVGNWQRQVAETAGEIVAIVPHKLLVCECSDFHLERNGDVGVEADDSKETVDLLYREGGIEPAEAAAAKRTSQQQGASSSSSSSSAESSSRIVAPPHPELPLDVAPQSVEEQENKAAAAAAMREALKGEQKQREAALLRVQALLKAVRKLAKVEKERDKVQAQAEAAEALAIRLN
uniref:Uncharacterized protein n=1 Tax=Chromera velia CCMP2878 TaxID=1169474 RepID=A0A0G4HNQ8_9ALVE|eukprot:Cvel_7659.t1-p1 / transcript=Cvel_7659.t1 / gene=Cvel_7659 / organism=Chromera_velia_CCMP2878 / gene_product=hypothetical protein / transcript_product=hypothetical protein / location=Cvel_scaffold406:8221-14441(+) / protein_length=180 / sequence_SO=supercontig / SO=protein_coding / is_pseudo=false